MHPFYWNWFWTCRGNVALREPHARPFSWDRLWNLELQRAAAARFWGDE